MSRKNRRAVASPAVAAEIAANPVAPAAAVNAAAAAVDAAPPTRTAYAVTAAMLASLDPTTLIPIGANHDATRNKNGTVPGIPTRYLYAMPAGTTLNGMPVDPAHPNHPTLDASLSLAATMLAAADAIPDYGITTHDAIVRSTGLRYAFSAAHSTTRTAGDVDAADFAVGFTARVLDSIDRTALPENLRARVTPRLMRRGLRATRHERIAFVRTILNATRTALNP